MKWSLLVVMLLLASILPASMVRAQESEDVLELTGTLNGANFKILVPQDWNGTLLVYAHGYGAWPAPSVDFPPAPVQEQLLAMGYAMAGSAFRNPGWSAKEGVQNTLALTNYFRGHVGNPERVILWGISMGGLITQMSIEKYPGIYDAAVPLCSSGSGATRHFDWLFLGFGLAYDATFGWPSSWGPVEDIRDDLVFSEVFPIVQPQLSDPANKGLWEFIRLVNDMPEASFYSEAFTPIFLATAGRAEIELRAGGPVAQNLDHVYRLTQAEIAYLNGLGVDAEGLLASMNARTNIQAQRSARNYIERHGDPSGDIRRPVLTMHTIADSPVPVSSERAYRELVAAEGQEELLVQVYTDGLGHCNFTSQQIMAVLLATDNWLDSATPPDPADAAWFPPSAGFLPGYEPPPWPQPPQ